MATSSYYNSWRRFKKNRCSGGEAQDPLRGEREERAKDVALSLRLRAPPPLKELHGLQVSARSSRERWARSGFPGQLRLRFFAKDPLFLTKRKGPQVMQIREHKSCNGKQKLYSVLVAHPFHCDLCRPFVQESL
ncbi:hypothetical protein AGIG_G25085 [Arapaima gigas]